MYLHSIIPGTAEVTDRSGQCLPVTSVHKGCDWPGETTDCPKHSICRPGYSQWCLQHSSRIPSEPGEVTIIFLL